MISKYILGEPIETFALAKNNIEEVKNLKYFSLKEDEKTLTFTYKLKPEDYVYGLGETTGHFNKRNSNFISFNLDNPYHRDNTRSLYASHNFLLVDSINPFGIFFDSPSKIEFEIDYKKSGIIKAIVHSKDIKVYIIEEKTPYEITKVFLDAIGQSYIPPLWAFGYGQSRWGYKNQRDIEKVIKGYESIETPLDFICMDIDYMEDYKDFTVNKKRFKDLKAFQDKCLEKGIHLVPIIDCGIKVEENDSTYEEGVANNYFCKNKEGNDYQAAVWPGMTHFPDFYNKEARIWFGSKYKYLTDMHIEGFWNDMNEPAIFYSEYNKKRTSMGLLAHKFKYETAERKCRKRFEEEYSNFYHNIDGRKCVHLDVHNAFGAMMLKASSEGLEKLLDHRFLLFGRSSYIGASRYAGIWTGDNNSSFNSFAHNIYQMPSLNMCGFLYSGADTGGFGGNCNEELMLRWLAFSLFTPLMRNHTSLMTKNQECYVFKNKSYFKDIISLRYRLLPYIYSEFMKAALNKDMYIKPLSFIFDNCKDIEDQLLVGESIMIAPIMKENETKRKVYLPINMTKVTYDGNSFKEEYLIKGNYTIDVGLNEVVFFILDNKLVSVSNNVSNTSKIDLNDVTLLGNGTIYKQYIDDGLTRIYTLDNIVIKRKDV